MADANPVSPPYGEFMRSIRRGLGCLVVLGMSLWGCAARAPQPIGGGVTDFRGERQVDPRDVRLVAGYRIEVVADHLTFPTGVAFDGAGRLHVVESGQAYGAARATPRLLRVIDRNHMQLVARGGSGPWNGVTWSSGAFYIADGGQPSGGAILRISPAGGIDTLLAGLPSFGEHHTNPVAVRDGWIYFGQGTATNSGVVGPDDFAFGWPIAHPEFHDIPCRDVTLTGINFRSADPRSAGASPVETGAFLPFGTGSVRGLVVQGQIPCSGSILKIRAAGGAPELVAWGLRNPFGLAFDRAGTLHAIDLGYDDRGSRPVRDASDHLYAIEPGTWYGWPDYQGGKRLDAPGRAASDASSGPAPLIDSPTATPPPALATFPPHTTATGIEFSTSSRFGWAGSAFVAEFGDLAPTTGTVAAPVGFKVVRVDPKTGATSDFAVNRHAAKQTNGPASRLRGRGLERPIALRFSPDATSLYVVDFGVMTIGDDGPVAHPETGVIWRISRTPSPASKPSAAKVPAAKSASSSARTGTRR